MVLQGGEKRAAPLGELSLQRTFAAVVVGDSWVAVVKAHVDVLGPVYPFNWEYEVIEPLPGANPSVKAICEALRTCWERLKESGDTPFSKMFVCLPGWACRTKVVKERMILSGRHGGQDRPIVVTEREVDDLIARAVADHGKRGYVVAECLPRYFIVENGRKTDDPVGEMSSTLAMEAHLVLADKSIVKAVRDTLADLDIQINVMKSPYTVVDGNLSEEELDGNTLFVDVDRFKTYCSFLVRGEFVRMTAVDTGSRSILEGTAEALDLTPGELGDWINDWEEHVQWARWNPEDHAPVLHHSVPGPRSWEALDEAVAEPARELFGRIYEHLKFVNARERIHISRVVFAGDDYLTLRALKKAGEEYLGIACKRLVPDRLHNADRIHIPGLARMVGLVRQEEHTIRRAQPYLSQVERGGMDRFNDWFRNRGAGLARRAGRCVADTLKCGVGTSLAAGTRIWGRIRAYSKRLRERRVRRSRHPLSRPSLRDQVLIR